MMESNSNLVRDLFYHIVLPPRVPEKQDSDLEYLSCALLKRLIAACDEFEKLGGPLWSKPIQDVLSSLNIATDLIERRLEKSTIIEHFRQLRPGLTIILHVDQQNAAVLVRQENE
jgi:hypothetical protein